MGNACRRGHHVDDTRDTTEVKSVYEFVQNGEDSHTEITLRVAAGAGHLEVVNYIVEKHLVDFNSTNKYGYTALMNAARCGHIEVVKYLANQPGVDVNTTLVWAAGTGNLEVIKNVAEQCGTAMNVKDNDGNTMLILAAQFGNLETVRYLTQQFEASVNAKNDEGNTALIMAAREGNFEIVQYLAEQCRADIHIMNCSEKTAIMLAIECGNSQIIQYLAEQCGADLKFIAKNKSTIMATVVQDGNIDLVRYLIEHCGENVEAKTNDGSTALLLAAEYGHIEILNYLVKQCGANVNTNNKNGKTALMWAAENGRIELTVYLVKQCGVDVNVQNSDGNTALITAAEHGNFDVARFLAIECSASMTTKNNDGKTAILCAAETGNRKIVQLLAEQCNTTMTRDANGNTALMLAVKNGNFEVLRYLSEKCYTDANVMNNDGNTPLMRAAETDNFEVVWYLVEQCGADVNAINHYGNTALMWAAEYGRIEHIRYLVQQGHVDVNVKNNYGYTALMWAAEYGRFEVVQFLANHCDIDINAKNMDGNTALMWAAKYGRIEIVRYLAKQGGADVKTTLLWAASNGNVQLVRYLCEQCGAIVNAKDNSGFTPLIRAAIHGNVEAVTYLAEKGANVNDMDNDGNTALMRAAMHGNLQIVQHLVEKFLADVHTKNSDGNTALMRATENDNIEIVRYLAEQCDADVNVTNKYGNTAIRLAANSGYREIKQLLTRFLRLQSRPCNTNAGDMRTFNKRSSSCFISPFEVELTVFCPNCNFGGEFRAKWLDADVVVKLFIPDTSYSTFKKEVSLWQQLRHPNVIKMYGACEVNRHLQLFICEFASNGSLLEQTATNTWKYMYEAALGLEYLHERGIVHGDLRCSNVLIGSDGMAKLANFGLSAPMTKSRRDSFGAIGSIRWQSPEVLEGKSPSYASDLYSLGMCILEATTRKVPWSDVDEMWARGRKLRWAPEADQNFPLYAPKCPNDHARKLVWRMCSLDPNKRISLSCAVTELERLAIMEISSSSQQEEVLNEFLFEYDCRKFEEVWLKLDMRIQKCNNIQYCAMFDQLKKLREWFVADSHKLSDFTRFYELLIDFSRIVKKTSEQSRIIQIISTRDTLYPFQRRVNSLMVAKGETVDAAKKRENRWQQAYIMQIADLVSKVSTNLKSVDERIACLRLLQTEMHVSLGKYSQEQYGIIQEAYEKISAEFKGVNRSEITPNWFIPSYELIIDEWKCLGEGGFGRVCRAKWLDSDVVVKQLFLAGSDSKSNSSMFNLSHSSLSSLSVSLEPSGQTYITKRAETVEMFRREVNIWFGFSHPHVVRLFGACHVGTPFFVCEYASNGTLINYLRKHPDQVWAKLHEAALGIQYLHARNVIHGDLKGNNIVIGSDGKAKVTDFGLSSVMDSDDRPVVSGAWHWVAPECFAESNTRSHDVRSTFASDVYSFGMCIVESLRVVEVVTSEHKTLSCLPWGNLDNFAVKCHVTKGKLPGRPAICNDKQWEMIKRMCKFVPNERLKMSTVVDMLANLANANDSSSIIPGMSSMKTIDTHKIIAAMLDRLKGDVKNNNDVLPFYISLLKNLEHIYEQVIDNRNVSCYAALHSLVVDVDKATTSLQVPHESLIMFAETMMQYYALERRLDKLCDAYFLARDRLYSAYSSQ